MTIIFTHSHDMTTDMRLDHVSDPKKIFRFNFDLFSDYEVTLTPTDFVITDPTGRTVNERSVKKGYYRNPTLVGHGPGEENYVEMENWTAYRAIIHRLIEERKMVLVEPFTEKSRLNKVNQLRVAGRYFQTPATTFTNWPSSLLHRGPMVAKSLNGANLGGKTLYTTLADPTQLAANHPWYVQPYIEATHDVTVVFIQGDCFAAF